MVMQTQILKEEDWSSFIQKDIVPLCITRHTACVLALVGDLGAGKTTFSKTLLHQIGVVEHVQSPTFSIINSYDISFGKFTKVFHIDVYRIEEDQELKVLHIEDILNNPENLVVIEWADTIETLIPDDAVWIFFEHDTLKTRKVSIKKENSKNI
jgi:tRNA threonylcarbamoyladenosine biosynthesis protein TsaE